MEIQEASNGMEAVDYYNSVKYDLVILDYQMPLLSGFEAAKRILSIDKSAKIILLCQYLKAPSLGLFFYQFKYFLKVHTINVTTPFSRLEYVPAILDMWLPAMCPNDINTNITCAGVF